MDLNHITITGAREHNLKDVSLTIPKNKLIVFTGLSGSGKSSLAFDTIYAEGQRRYVESLSSYARQFLGVMSKPDVDHIEGLSPAISIDQKTTSHNPRSTVGTITEIYDYLRLLFARAGHPHCPKCGREVAPQSIDQIVSHIFELATQESIESPARIVLLAPIIQNRKGEFQKMFGTLIKKGYQRARIDGQNHNLLDNISLIKTNKHTIEAVVDRLTISKQQLKDEVEFKRLRSRINQSVEDALKLADGVVMASIVKDNSLTFPDNPKEVEDHMYSENKACSNCNISLPEIEPRLFSFNSPQGACAECNGLGTILKIEPEKIIAPTLTLSEGAIIPFSRMLSQDTWWTRLVETVVQESGYSFRKTPFEEYKKEDQELMLYGSPHEYTVHGQNRQGMATQINEKFLGFVGELEKRHQETDSDFIRKDIEQYMVKKECELCKGTRLKDEALAVHVLDTNIAQVTDQAINQALAWAEEVGRSELLTDKEKAIATPIIKEIISRLHFLTAVGLSYLTLNREAGSLAGGEAQRIRLASQIGTGLSGVLYILDEPTIGLHQRDNHQLIETLINLRDKGNTVIVVEHDRDVMLSADQVVDFGPKAGILGGEVVAQGTPDEIKQNKKSLTGKYLNRKKDVLRNSKFGAKIVSDDEVKSASKIRITGAAHHNLKHIDVDFPLNNLTCITGISGSGKSTLLHDILYFHLHKTLGKTSREVGGEVESIMIPEEIRRVTLIDQSPIGKTPRSNPATYTKVFDLVRKVFANTQEAAVRGYKAGRFSFNVKGGRCEACQGDGQIKIEMQFLPDVYVTCDVCNGKRYNEETLEVTYQDKNIAEVLAMSIDEAAAFFKNNQSILKKITTMQEVGLGYIKLGQPAPTLSGGEAQRVKLAKELSTRTLDHVMYLLDEPTTGLHFEDVQNLLNVLDKLVAQNNTVVMIEHNLDIIKNADWIIDLGPEGGAGGGEIVAEGTVQTLINHPKSETGRYLKEEIEAK